MKKISILIILIYASLLSAGGYGGYSGAFIRLGLGARALSLGNTGIADQPSAYTMYYNPATVAFLEKKVASLSYSFMPLDRNFNYIGFAMKVPPSAGLSLGWIHAGNDDFDSYSMIGEKTDPIANSMNALYFNFARTFKGRFAIGLSYKYFWEMINNQDFDYLSKGWGFDFGLRFMIMESLFVGASVRDVGSKLKVNTTEIFGKGGTTTDRFPVKYGLGCFYKTPLNWLNVLYDFEWSDKEEYRHHIGLEALYTMGNNTEKNVAVRMGWDDDKFTAGAGMGFILYKFISQLDYALVTADDGEGVSHVFSWQVYF